MVQCPCEFIIIEEINMFTTTGPGFYDSVYSFPLCTVYTVHCTEYSHCPRMTVTVFASACPGMMCSVQLSDNQIISRFYAPKKGNSQHCGVSKEAKNLVVSHMLSVDILQVRCFIFFQPNHSPPKSVEFDQNLGRLSQRPQICLN